MTDNTPESLDDTYRRLAPYAAGAAGVPQPPEPPARPYEPPVAVEVHEPRDAGAPKPARRRRQRRGRERRGEAASNRRPAIIAGSIVAGIIVIVLALSTIAWTLNLFAPEPATPPAAGPVATGDPTFTDEWTSYPGHAYVDSADVLDDPTMEEVIAGGTAFIDEYKAALTEEFGIEWAQTYPEYLEHVENGYAGDSMLYEYDATAWQGTIVMNDPGARQRTREIFETITAKHGALDSWLSNDLSKDDPDDSKKRFGGEVPATQPMWTVYATDLVVSGSTAATRVYDTNIQRDPAFDGDYWFELEGVASGSFIVTVSFSSSYLLAAEDRDEFIERLAEYDESGKPAGR